MNIQGIILISAMNVMALVTVAMAQQVGSDGHGIAVINVETDPVGLPGAFVFNGVPEGTTTAGVSISASGLAPGEYSSVESGTPPGLVLASINCDDSSSASPSQGEVAARKATFNVEPGESVTCVFLYRSTDLAGSGTQPDVPGGPGGSGGTTPGADEPGGPGSGLPGSDEPGGCDAPDLVPKAGLWNVSNLAGRMVCGSMINMPLKASQETGMLEIRDCGWTVVGTDLAEDTAPLTMRAIDATSGRYTGTVGGAQDGIPMMIEFNWQLNSDESIVGELQSEVTQQGMTCNMSRPFELRYAGP